MDGGPEKAVTEIARDLDQDTPMRRLLLGDVGTGKTAVALAAIAQCVAATKQAVILAPTSILAEQYMDAVAPLARATGAKIALATGHRCSLHINRNIGQPEKNKRWRDRRGRRNARALFPRRIDFRISRWSSWTASNSASASRSGLRSCKKESGRI